jgi:Bacterial lectin
MRLPKNVYLGFALSASIGISLVDGRAVAARFAYTNFDSTAGLILKEHAGSFDGKLRLSPAIAGLGLGGAWLDSKQPVRDGFDTTFQIQITDKHSSGADGFAFVIQSGPSPALGKTGQGLGYGGVTNQFVIHFDNYHWGDHPAAGGYDEIAVLAASSPKEPLYNIAANVIASANKQVRYSDGAVHTVRIVYVPGNLQVFLDDLENPVMTVYANLARLMELDHGRAWVGFTATSGADWQNHDLVSWAFDSSGDSMSDESGTTPSATPQTQMVNPSPSPVPVYIGDDPQPSPTTPLRIGPSFSYALPGDVGLTYQIEASTNLVEWSPLTNASFYFRDPESTNYDRRFYRFRKN